MEQTIDDIKAKMKKHHIKRLQNGECTIELGFIFSDLLSSIERVSDLCANVAAYMIEVADDRLETQIYSHDVRKNGDNYRQKYESYRQNVIFKSDLQGEDLKINSRFRSGETLVLEITMALSQ